MPRKPVLKLLVSDSIGYNQEQALLNTTIILVRSCGPTAFLVGETTLPPNIKFKVCLGDPHTCSCPAYKKKKKPCIHIYWVLLRLFRVPQVHQYSFRHGLLGSQISELLCWAEFGPSSSAMSHLVPCQRAKSVRRKEIQDQDACPICQESLLEIKEPVCYCRFGCGNNIHILCMDGWAAHQKTSFTFGMVKCPLCRQDFNYRRLLRKEVVNSKALFTAAEKEKPHVHLGVVCHSCRSCPVTGRCFKCTVCSYFYLCEDCMKKDCHPQHPFASRATRTEKWRLVGQDAMGEAQGAACPPEDDNVVAGTDSLPRQALERLPALTVRLPLLNKGMQCRICLQSFHMGQHVRTLPCHHKFHVDCVDQILLESNSCPLDGCVIYSPLTWKTRKSSPTSTPTVSSSRSNEQEKETEDTSPGSRPRTRSTGVARRRKPPPPK
ncbi:E3 ubiquitin-protein ligase ZSWIM2 [Cololabis saira]|uniref:E3 ubiquitin-protein ligase ZSWIM2 n=1 Tax=Cololabis saira TaxID=129043 RepID=UPI002AD31038|nr:E3 ubiquitin-protein ligase ZSWIM2 [Cololabis saira]